MIVPTYQTTAQEIASRESRRLLESEHRPAFSISHHIVSCTNPDAMPGQRNYVVDFQAENNIQTFDGKHWVNQPV